MLATGGVSPWRDFGEGLAPTGLRCFGKIRFHGLAPVASIVSPLRGFEVCTPNVQTPERSDLSLRSVRSAVRPVNTLAI